MTQHIYNKKIQGLDTKKAATKPLFELLCIFNCRTPGDRPTNHIIAEKAAELKAIREERNRRHEDDEAFMNYAGENADASFVQPLSSDAINEAVAEDDLSVTELG